jgi:peptidoglycan hydrolase CwlO-like protein
METEEVPDFRGHRLAASLLVLVGLGGVISLLFFCIHMCVRSDDLDDRINVLEQQQNNMIDHESLNYQDIKDLQDQVRQLRNELKLQPHHIWL